MEDPGLGVRTNERSESLSSLSFSSWGTSARARWMIMGCDSRLRRNSGCIGIGVNVVFARAGPAGPVACAGMSGSEREGMGAWWPLPRGAVHWS